jgi:hypothetical protein
MGPRATAVSTTTTATTERRSIFGRPWFWVAVGAVLAAGAVATFVALNPSYPDASFGHTMTTSTGN